MTTTGSQNASPSLERGTEVEVRSRFAGTWSTGFEIVSENPAGYRVKRRSDGVVLPVAFGPDRIRRRAR